MALAVLSASIEHESCTRRPKRDHQRGGRENGHMMAGAREPEEAEANRRVPIQVPPWIAGNDILSHMGEVEFKAWPIDASTYHWEVETKESYEHRLPRLLTVETVAGAGLPERWNLLEGLPDPGVASSLTPERILAERDRILAERPGDLTALATAIRLMVTTVPHSDIASAVRGGYESLAALRSDDDPTPLLPELSVQLIRMEPAVMKRLAFARVLMRIEEEPDLLTNRPSPAPGETVFSSGWHLTSDLAVTRDAYLAPLFLAASPWVWCIPCQRIAGIVIYDLGMAIIGRRGDEVELLQLFTGPGALSGGERPDLTHNRTIEATTWWVGKMNGVLAQMSDFANYCDASRRFVPRRLVEVFMSVEQLGRRLQGAAAHDRDLATRRALAFDAFDTLKGLGIIDLFEGCKLSRAERALRSLESEIPAQAADLLLLPARRAVEALRRVQEGFSLSSRIEGTVVRLPDRHGNDRDCSIEEAAALYLQLLRNANHGFTPERDTDERRDQILLMAHNGDVPGDVAFLPYLYWLEAIAHPEYFAGRLRPARRAATEGSKKK